MRGVNVADCGLVTGANYSTRDYLNNLAYSMNNDLLECVCGKEIPRGTDWEPSCRHCEALRLNRLVGEI